MMKPWLFVLYPIFVIILAFANNNMLTSTQSPSPTPTYSPGWLDSRLSDDIMPSVAHAEVPRQNIAASDYTVTPILFVPNDLTPNPYALQTIDRQMQVIQRWYAEQLRGTTFTLEPAQIITGWHAQAYYYGDVWNLIWSDMYSHGYPWLPNRVRALFFQNDGFGAPAVGSANQFIVGIELFDTLGDCVDVGCLFRIKEGVAAHELGHAFNLGHTVSDPEGSQATSVMNGGWMSFPWAAVADTSTNPERELLLASPFFNVQMNVEDAGFEDCLASWTNVTQSVSCGSSSQRSGLSTLLLWPNGGQPYQVSQQTGATAGQTYDLSGWVKQASGIVEVGAYDTPDEAWDVVAVGDYAYIANRHAGLVIINVSNPISLTQSGVYNTPGIALDVKVVGQYAYVADHIAGLRIINVSKPNKPSETGFYSFSGVAEGVAVAGPYAYVADSTKGLRVIRVSNPASPSQAAYVAGNAYDVTVVGNYAYVADTIRGLSIVDISTPTSPTEVGVSTIAGGARSVDVLGNFAYVVSNDGLNTRLHIINISNPAAPLEVSLYDTPCGSDDVAVSGDYAYIACDGLLILDISNPMHPLQVRALDTPWGAYGVSVAGDSIYLADGYAGLRVFKDIPYSLPDLRVQVDALSSAGTVLTSFEAGRYNALTTSWKRFGTSVSMPAGTVKARVAITTSGSGPLMYVDDLDFHVAQFTPAAPLPLIHTDGDAIPTLQPMLRWADVPSATSFRLQIATDKLFDEPIIDVTTPSPFYTVSSGLSYNQRYFWRVRGINGMGPGDWSPAWSIIPRQSNRYYDDEFDTSELRSGWFWVREDPSHWRLSREKLWWEQGALALTTQVGDLSGASNTAKNLLLREAPLDDFEVNTWVDVSLQADSQQAGLLAYQDDDNYIKVMRIMDGGSQIEVQAEVGGVIVEQTSTPILTDVLLRILRKGNTYAAYYSVDGATWRPLGQPVAANWSNLKIGLAAYNQPNRPETTALFYWFRVKPGCVRITANVIPPGSGSVDQGIGDCDHGLGHRAGFNVTLMANPVADSWFSSWSGDVAGTTNPISITAQHDITITAHFSSRVFLPLILRGISSGTR